MTISKTEKIERNRIYRKAAEKVPYSGMNGELSRIEQAIEEEIVTDFLKDRNRVLRALHREARDIINYQTKPGETESYGPIYLQGDLFGDYEPQRQMRDTEGNIIDQRDSTLRFWTLEAAFDRKDLEQMKKAAEEQQTKIEKKEDSIGLKERLVNLFKDWCHEKMAKGWPIAQLTFENFIRDATLWAATGAAAE